MSERIQNRVRLKSIPENVARIIREKDRIIKVQAKRIEQLEQEAEKLRKERDIFSTKVTLLTYKLQLNNPKFSATAR